MALPRKPELGRIVINALRDAGAQVLFTSNTHPFEFTVINHVTTHHIRLYIWNLTHGGGQARPIDELRIQATGVDSFTANPKQTAIILGWHEASGVFVAFDSRVHQGPIGTSSSIQVRRSCVQTASISGWSFSYKDSNGEMVIAFTPNNFLTYLSIISEIHSDPVNALEAVAHDLDLISADQQATHLSLTDRPTVVRQSAVMLRSAKFRSNVLAAYDYRCATCGIQLNLVEAAHIIPVAANGSDEIANGLSLCSQHHLAFDSGLILITGDYKICVNDNSIARFRMQGREGGFDAFYSQLRDRILLPNVETDNPNPANLEWRIQNSLF